MFHSNTELRDVLALFRLKKKQKTLAVVWSRMAEDPLPKTNINIAASLSAAVNQDPFPSPARTCCLQVLP